MKRGTWIGGMDFQRCRPTEYNYSTYDNEALVYGNHLKRCIVCNNIGDALLKYYILEIIVALGNQGIIFYLK